MTSEDQARAGQTGGQTEPDKETSEKQVSDNQAGEKQAGDNQAGGRQLSETPKSQPEEQAPEEQTASQTAKPAGAFARQPNDTGSPEVQIARLTERIGTLSGHLRGHKKDQSSRLGMLKMVSRRRRLLDYLKSRRPQAYQRLLAALGLRR